MSLNKYLVFSRDPGGAEILSRLIKAENIQGDCLYILEGAAKKIFLNILGDLPLVEVEEAESLFSKFKIQKIFCSTSGHYGPEKLALRLSKKFQVETIAVIDHWTNFLERFTMPEAKEIIFPQNIYFSDEIQADLLRPLVSNNSELIQIPNYYLDDLRQDFNSRKMGEDRKYKILFLDEPLKDDAVELDLDDHGYDEFSAFRFLLENIHKTGVDCKTIIIRLHPRSVKNKYDEIMKEYSSFMIEYSTNSNLVDDLVQVRSAFGCTTMALIVSDFCEIETYSIIPVSDAAHGLPSNKIKYLRDLK